jgi:hypothetical protein
MCFHVQKQKHRFLFQISFSVKSPKIRALRVNVKMVPSVTSDCYHQLEAGGSPGEEAAPGYAQPGPRPIARQAGELTRTTRSRAPGREPWPSDESEPPRRASAGL